MFLPFKINEEEIRYLVEEYRLPRSFSYQYRDVKSLIRDSAYNFLDDGSRLEENWFPTKEMECNVFISHSHKDITLVKRFASWLNEKLGLACFIDSLYWENADDLLDFLCWQYYRFRNRHYACELRDELASHVHAMLSMALMKMMDQTECVIFVESNNAVTNNGMNKQTYSPWLYEETNFANMLRTNIPERMKSRVVDSTRSFSLEFLRENYMQLLYDVSFERFGNLYSEQLRSIYGRELHGEDAMDAIYRSHEAFRRYVRD